jgi:hypothetical protein
MSKGKGYHAAAYHPGTVLCAVYMKIVKLFLFSKILIFPVSSVLI